MSLIIYGDFSSAFCYLASKRVDALRSAGIDVDWRAVEQAPRLPVTGRRLDVAGRQALDTELTEMRDLLLPDEQVTWTVPEFVPKTEAAVAGYAEAYGAGVADDIRRLLFRAYWCRGLNIGDPEKLRKPMVGPILRGHSHSDPLRLSGYAVSVSRGPITTSAWRRIRMWQDEWEALGRVPLPVLVENGLPVSGSDVPRQLAKRIIHLNIAISPELPEPEQYPLPRVRPPAWWATQAGGRWSYHYRRT
ncbi:DsbA family protein [Amycolatopsis sp. K13G38]|uniref:DsbA family protein n=1 Tax=Amycolatopsis acididurans TaxID=2724524 RepID=A0ABX1JKR4_9PSEU|nr:DsbA family protein [Amycolatopsis acididurans]NKQ58852.1 DsbA family protein [Amycolatopsis acididurans]